MINFKFEDDYNPNNQKLLKTIKTIKTIKTMPQTTIKNDAKDSKSLKNPNKESRDEKIQALAKVIYREFTEKGSLSDEFLRSIS